MKNLVIFVLLLAVGFFLRERFFKQPARMAQVSTEGDWRSECVSAIDQQIASLLTPLPLQQSGPLAEVSSQQQISRIRYDLLGHYSTLGAENTKAIETTNQLCDLLLKIMSERNFYIRRVNNIRTNTQPSALVSSGPADSSAPVDRWIKRGSDTAVRQAEQQGRIRWWETTISNQWNVRCEQLRREEEFRYSLFRSFFRG